MADSPVVNGLGAGALSILDFTHELLKRVLTLGDRVVDATVGNGHDTLFLARCVGISGHVYGFDIQKQAVENTRLRLSQGGCAQQVTLVQAGHEHAVTHLPGSIHGELSCAMFNLGYLPGSDKGMVTRKETTICALRAFMGMLRPGGVITLHLYAGHSGGSDEADAVLAYGSGLQWPAWRVLLYHFVNKQKNREKLLVLEKTR